MRGRLLSVSGYVLAVLLTAAAAFGIGLSLAALTVTYRDFRYVVPFLIQSWMYISPVIYPVSVVPAQWQWLLALNPMAGIIDAYRSVLIRTCVAVCLARARC